jgi:hypothetical protein
MTESKPTADWPAYVRVPPFLPVLRAAARLGLTFA